MIPMILNIEKLALDNGRNAKAANNLGDIAQAILEGRRLRKSV